MNLNVLSLLERIEESRRFMHELSKDKNLTDPEVVTISQGLDRLLNEYYLAIKNSEINQTVWQ
ncbi:MAG: aspartyl-phosphate phosphatase Spo0E family protein [Desulfitobacterium hafniense]|nr:aspartyl-phosphate phosphatase Spo0E family protein [Desulfitobacterium hafniense]